MTQAASTMSDYEVRREGWAALTERLGASGAMRFLMQYDPGNGDYTAERQRLLADLGLEDALTLIRAREEAGGVPQGRRKPAQR